MQKTLSPRVVATVLVAFGLVGAGQASYGPALRGLSDSFGLSISSSGVMLSIHSLGAFLGVVLTTPLERRAAGRWRAGGAITCLLTGAALLGTASTWRMALLGAMLIGMNQGILTTTFNGLFATSFSAARSAAMLNLLNAVFGVGAIVGPLVVGQFTARPQLPYLLLAGGAALIAPFMWLIDDRLPARPSVSGQTSPNNGALLVGFVVLMALGVGVEASSAGWGATYLGALGASPAAAANVTALFYVVFTLSRLIIAPISLYIQPAKLVIGAFATAVVLLGLTLVPSLAAASLAALGGALALFFPNAFGWISRRFANAPTAISFCMMGALAGGTVFPALVGVGVGRLGVRSIPGMIIALALAALAVSVAQWRGGAVAATAQGAPQES